MREEIEMAVSESLPKLAYSTAETAEVIPGRRDFFVYRDLGVKEASVGKLSAQTMTAVQGMTHPTGWHYHECEGQFLFILNGWIDLEYETGDQYRLEKGQSLYIPGGMRHNETATSDDLQLLEITLPSNMGTVPCAVPFGE